MFTTIDDLMDQLQIKGLLNSTEDQPTIKGTAHIWGRTMLLECNEIKLLIVNLDNVSCDLDVDLSDLIDYKDCIFIVSDNSRAEQLKKDNDEFSYVSPTGWLGFINTLTISRILRDNSIEPLRLSTLLAIHRKNITI